MPIDNKQLQTINPPKDRVPSLQLEMFSSFLSNDTSQVSNTIQIWDSIPKYFFTKRLVREMRTVDGLGKPYTFNYEYLKHSNDNALDKTVEVISRTVTIQPAIIEEKDGSFKAYYPTATEELVEEVLKKMLADQNSGFHDVEQVASWVMFTFRGIARELKEMGRGRSIKQIKHAIEVMSKCIITVKDGEDTIYQGPILAELVTVGQKEYKADPTKKCLARLPLLISLGINRFDTRQFNYLGWGKLDEQLARWLLKKLVNKFVNAGDDTSYHFKYTGIKTESMLLTSSPDDNRKKVLSALNELVSSGIILKNYDVKTTTNKDDYNRIVEVKYTVEPTPKFIKEQKAANKRNKFIQQKISGQLQYLR